MDVNNKFLLAILLYTCLITRSSSDERKGREALLCVVGILER